MEENLVKFGKRIKKLRIKKGYWQENRAEIPKEYKDDS